MPQYTKVVSKLPSDTPFVGPEALERKFGRFFRVRLGANENTIGASPHVIAAMREAVGDVWKYGDPENYDLKTALAAHHGISPGNITVGQGIDGLFGTLAQMLVSEASVVVTSLGGYPTFNYKVAGAGGILHQVPYLDGHADTQALAKAAHETGAAMVYVSNPDNPTGSWLGSDEISKLLNDLPENCLLCLDEAYIEFAPTADVVPIDVDDPRLIRFRTFSKAYGIAGARIGYGIARTGLISTFDKVRDHFGVNRVGQAGALAALADQDWLNHVLISVGDARDRLGAIAADNGLIALPSVTNFVAMDCRQDGRFSTNVVSALAEEGVFIRKLFAPVQDSCIRISAGRVEELDIIAETLPIALERARQKI